MVDNKTDARDHFKEVEIETPFRLKMVKMRVKVGEVEEKDKRDEGEND